MLSRSFRLFRFNTRVLYTSLFNKIAYRTNFKYQKNYKNAFNSKTSIIGLMSIGFIYKLKAQENEEKPDLYDIKENPLKKIIEENGGDVYSLDITLYQYQVCPFCCKVRAFLDYYGIPYKIVEVNPMTKSELKFSEYKKVPVVIINGIQLNDSTFIISCLNELLNKQIDENENKWRRWVDSVFVHTLPVNIYRTMEEAVQAFEYISDMNNFSWYQRVSGKYGGSTVMYAVSKNLKKKYNIQDERAALYKCGNDWVNELGSKQFHGGDTPNLADLAVYGILTSIEGLKAFHDLIENTKIGGWYYRMKQYVNLKKGFTNE